LSFERPTGDDARASLKIILSLPAPKSISSAKVSVEAFIVTVSFPAPPMIFVS